jgi:hypothetical protein
MSVLQVRPADVSLMNPVLRVGSTVSILTVHFLEFGESFGQLHSLQSKMLDNRWLIKFHENEILSAHDDEKVKNSFFSSADFSRESWRIKDATLAADRLSRTGSMAGNNFITAKIKAK